jgi:hypothetical protein
MLRQLINTSGEFLFVFDDYIAKQHRQQKENICFILHFSPVFIAIFDVLFFCYCGEI